MAADQRNFQTFTYVDDDAVTWNKRGAQDAAINAVDGSTALTTGAALWPRETRRFHTRKAVFQDPTTFRTVRIIVYTAAALAAIVATPPTLALHVAGETGTVNYTLIETIAEVKKRGKTARQLPDHA